MIYLEVLQENQFRRFAPLIDDYINQFLRTRLISPEFPYFIPSRYAAYQNSETPTMEQNIDVMLMIKEDCWGDDDWTNLYIEFGIPVSVIIFI